MPDKMVWCDWELARFPADEFVMTREYGQVHQPAGANGPAHTTSGEPLEETRRMRAMDADQPGDPDGRE